MVFLNNYFINKGIIGRRKIKPMIYNSITANQQYNQPSTYEMTINEYGRVVISHNSSGITSIYIETNNKHPATDTVSMQAIVELKCTTNAPHSSSEVPDGCLAISAKKPQEQL